MHDKYNLKTHRNVIVAAIVAVEAVNNAHRITGAVYSLPYSAERNELVSAAEQAERAFSEKMFSALNAVPHIGVGRKGYPGDLPVILDWLRKGNIHLSALHWHIIDIGDARARGESWKVPDNPSAIYDDAEEIYGEPEAPPVELVVNYEIAEELSMIECASDPSRNAGVKTITPTSTTNAVTVNVIREYYRIGAWGAAGEVQYDNPGDAVRAAYAEADTGNYYSIAIERVTVHDPIPGDLFCVTETVTGRVVLPGPPALARSPGLSRYNPVNGWDQPLTITLPLSITPG